MRNPWAHTPNQNLKRNPIYVQVQCTKPPAKWPNPRHHHLHLKLTVAVHNPHFWVLSSNHYHSHGRGRSSLHPRHPTQAWARCYRSWRHPPHWSLFRQCFQPCFSNSWCMQELGLFSSHQPWGALGVSLENWGCREEVLRSAIGGEEEGE